MPKEGLRYATKVDLKREAWDQPYLHVSLTIKVCCP